MKSKKDSGATPSTPPAAPASTPPSEPAAKPASGPRYQGSKHTAPATPIMPVPGIPPVQPLVTPPAPPAFQPTNILEELLLHAATQVEARPAFYQALLRENLIVLTAPREGEEPGEIKISEGAEVQLQVLHDGRIAIFTSEARIYDAGVVKEPVSFLRARGFDFFQMIQGANCMLNPFSPVGKPLEAEELADLLAGRLFEAPPLPEGQEAQVLLGQPAEYPEALAKSIRSACATIPTVKTVYLAQMHVQDSPEPPRLLLAFDVEGEDHAFLQDLGEAVRGNLGEHQLVDMLVVSPDPDDQLANYLRQTKPVYQRG
ncbi:enhanced serine sensitivity protein SseB C-terminal domain-containing protein [Hymenobacter translucens]|uniref:enhanced serine sensitivity protein SseB C-terminal domain-containing protein n=1 Tax=Hymenobacter translucens TaxID=2886507 RepID=UPI001D0E628E|nr:enhanced serine sensitivity protein SseB C-terminal domain-containing protein [Hymenobacter translucens]